MQANNDMPGLQSLDCFFIDLDGTFYLGNKLLPGSVNFIKKCREKKKKFIFLTNNSSKNATEYAKKLNDMGVNVTEDNILTSGEATTKYLKETHAEAKLFILGTASLQKEFIREGFIMDQVNPQYVIAGFDITLTYEKLCKACNFIRNGARFIATHPDLNCPTEKGPIPDCGAITAAITASTGISPKVIGKPSKEMINAAMKKSKSKRSTSAIIGDRLYTDMAMGQAAGITSILVLTGETTKHELDKSDMMPDYVFQSIEELGDCIY